MTIDEFEIGEKYFYGDSEFFCVDKGTKGVTLTLDDDDLDDTERWFVVGGSELDECEPIKAKASDQSDRVFLRWADMLEERLETALNQLVETQAKVAELKVHCRRSPSNKGASNEHEKTL